MENQTLFQGQNTTKSSCGNAASKYLNHTLLFVGFPITVVTIVKLLNRIYKNRRCSPAEVFLLQINFANIFLFLSLLLCFLEILEVYRFSMTVYMVFNSPALTARPIFLLAICMIFYFAIVHPVTYMSAKTWRHWEWLVTTLVWLYAMATIIGIIFDLYDFLNPFLKVMFFISLLLAIFFNITTLRALWSSGPGNGRQTLDPAKRKAFWVILSILAILLLYFLPRVFTFIYPYIAPTECEMFAYAWGSMFTMLPAFSEFAMPVIFLYSLHKLCV